MSKPPFTHLHVHTQYSLLDGAARLKDMFDACNEMGMTHIAMSDHGNLHGAYDFFHTREEGRGHPDHRDRGVRRARVPAQQAQDPVGPAAPEAGRRLRFRWLHPQDDLGGEQRPACTTSSSCPRTRTPRAGCRSGPGWTRRPSPSGPRGSIASTGCPSGELQTRLRLGQFDEALKAAAEYQDIFGKDRYFLELMDHGIEIEHRVRDGLLEIGKKLGIPPLVTNDSHYTYAHEAVAHDALLCIQTGKNLSDPDRFRFDGTGYYLKSTDEMYAIDSSDAWQEGCANTLLVAEQVDTAGMFEARNLMPKFDIPEGYTEVTWFKEEVRRGMDRRFPGGVPEDRQKQVEYEMDVIIQMGFPGYFLVVADFIMWAKNNGIAVGPGRGSAAGSIVAYAMGITDLDPIPHGLIFERFLNPERVSMPDVDIDFDERRRVEVIRYVTEKYGADKVAMIGTYGKIKAKNAIKDSARVLGYPYAMGDRLTKAMPADVLGKGIDLNGITDPSHPRYSEAGEIRAMYENEPDVKKVIDTAKGVEGLVRQMGVHAAGVIMSSEPIVDHAPIWVRHTDGVTITQWDYPQCESLGLLKMDFLGLRNLTIMDDAIKMVKANKGIDLEMLALPLDDPKTFELLCRGDTLGVFQFDGGPMRSLLRQMQPDNFEDISAVSALYRPGPMGMNSHTNYARAQERPPGDHADPQGAGGAAPGGPGGHLRPDRLPGAGAEGRPDHRRLLARRGRHPAPRDGQEEARRAGEELRPLPGGRPEERLQRRGDPGPVGRAGPLRRLRVQQGALRRVRPGLVLDRLPEGEPPRRVHGRAAHLGQGRQGQVGRLPQRVPAHGHQGAPAERQRVGAQLRRPGRRRDPLRPRSRAQRRYQRGRVDHQEPQGQGEVRLLPRLPRQGRGGGLQQAHHRVADQGGRVRQPWGTPARGSPRTSSR